MRRIFSVFALLILATACSQGRRSLVNQDQGEWWAPLDVCAVPQNSTLYGCFQITPNITDNFAQVDVLDLGIDSGETPFRVLARRAGDSVFHVLADNITASAGGYFDVYAKKGHYIEEYEEWRFETMGNYNEDNIWIDATPGTGLLITQVITLWPELDAVEE